MPHQIKQSILESLRAAKGDWVSGELLREPFSISRAAISKQVRGLRAKGYRIESSPRKGYRLLEDPDVLSPETLYPALAGTRFAAGKIICLDVTPSTNDDARAMSEAGAPEGALVLSEVQVNGRGRRGRTWFDSPGQSLLFSVLLRPPLEPSKCGMLPLMAAVAVRDGLAEAGFDRVGIKWPNDLIVSGRKLGGILCEISTDFDQVNHAILGIGLNINVPLERFPAEIRDLACSLKTETGTSWRRVDILTAILRHLELYLTDAWQGDFQPVIDTWKAHSVTLGKTITAQLPNGKQLTGMAEDLDPGGGLVLRDLAGDRHILTSGEVSIGTRPPANPPRGI